MLVLSRRTGEGILLGDDIVVSVLQVKGDRITLGIEAPREVAVLRQELVDAVAEENQAARACTRAALGSLRRALAQHCGVHSETAGEGEHQAEEPRPTGIRHR